jgi:hypothetical protein
MDILEYKHELNPYRFEDFRQINPKLTKKVYEFLRGNCTEWKIICGIEVKLKYDTEVLESNWILNIINKNIYENRFNSEYYMNTENWNYG